ncbi:F0F1 ATP synthase subunit gamma [Candidatus Vallotia cooleyia]|uniref:F0F1 ATP synthase subunit gamma n=1 Tax=Candidatus Vallotiella adelgis TaxID=1177211 RepID=UPI001D006675|nr:F0F1 ATP synthase subunit gamma [Candidatus Vallotia cooleyia]UDG81821.1 ATP synthase gamma chain [Candidatus Vallotia cooleyia]
MAGIKEIRSKINSVQNTGKITKAMEMVAVSKMRRAQERMRSSRPYAEKIRDIVVHMSKSSPEYRHPFMGTNTAAKTAGIILVTTDKGLCGGMNTNVLRLFAQKYQDLDAQDMKVEATAIGSKGLAFLRRFGGKIVSQAVNLGDTPHLENLIGAIKVQIDNYLENNYSKVYLVYTRFVNTMKQKPVIEQLLPLTNQHLDKRLDKNTTPKLSWDYIYEPDAQSVVDNLLVHYLEVLVYQAVAENMASEQSARMVAMKAASDNAKMIINDLQLVYNKSRQAAITKELSEIVSGAAAI